MSSSVSDENLEKKFQAVTNTQDSIQTLSLWLLHHKVHHQKIVSSWMKVLKKAKISHRLTLFYLANDVVQNGKRKGFLQFGNSFAEVLREATLLVRDEQIRPSVQRVFNIWEQRSVYSPEFIADLRAILANTKVPSTAHSKLLAEFKPDIVIEKLRLVMKLEIEAETKMSTINLSKLNATNAEIVQQLKDRTHGQKFKREFDESTRCLEEVIKIINKELKERTELILLLEQSEIYYDTQRGEAKIVANAYKNFGTRVKTLQKKLEDLTATFPSPVPSPCPDAPSPTTSDHELELKLPSEQKQSGMSSWLDTFAKKKAISTVPEKKAEVPVNDTNSLDSRLSNLLQNIPNLPSGLQSTIFANASSGNNTPLHDSVNSPLVGKKETESTTPIKDEYSGQNTPLQDEESTHSTHTFFSKIPSTSKPKDILTSLIQSVSSDKPDDSQKKDKYGFTVVDSYDQTGMSSFIQKIIPNVPAVSHSPSAPFFNSSQPVLSTPAQTMPIAQTSSVNSYETAPYQDLPVYSSKPIDNVEPLFIPSLVPSMPQDNFNYDPYSSNEYNPELETFDNEMDVDNAVVDVLDAQSPEIDSLSPDQSSEVDGMPRSIGNRRLSTLITVITKDSPDNSLPAPQQHVENIYKNDKENVIQEPWNNLIPTSKENEQWIKATNMQTPVSVLQEPMGNSSPTEEFFIGKEVATLPPSFYTSVPPPPVMDHGQPNGQNVNYMNPPNHASNITSEFPLSKIETVQSPRENGNWFGNNSWGENERMPYPPQFTPGFSPIPCSQDTRFFGRRNFPPPPPPPPSPRNFHPRNNWSPRHRPNSFHRPYGPPPNKRFAFRGRGRGARHYHQF